MQHTSTSGAFGASVANVMPARSDALECPYNVSMSKEVTLRQAGGSVSATLPKGMADRLRPGAGDRVLEGGSGAG